MKTKVLITLSLIIFNSFICYSQFGASISRTGISYDEMEEASRAIKRGEFSTAKSILEKYPDDRSALNSLGFIQESNHNYQSAIDYYEKSANKGNTHAMLNLGRLYYSGKGIKQDYAEALKWYKKAAHIGSAIAMYNLGYMYLKGLGTPKSKQNSLQWYKAAASQGYNKAQIAVDKLSNNNIWFIF